ncbi:MAG TPA: GerMN domain-containing protein [Bacilli bacterium]
MMRSGWFRGVALLLILSLPLFVAGCGLFKTKTEIDPPPAETEGGADIQTIAPAEEMAGSGKTAPVTLYFKDSDGYVAPITMDLPFSEGIAKRSLEYMVDGGPVTEMLPAGFKALLPKNTTMTVDIDAKEKLATVDFSKQFADYAASDERKILEAVTWTLTGFPSVDKVRLQIAGQDLVEMPVAGMPLDEPVSRAIGINVEQAAGVPISEASPVTLYFLNETSQGYRYYVPVTRLIEQPQDIAMAALQQLIKGPGEQSKLQEVIAPSAEILGVDQSDGLVTVNFGNQILSSDNTVPAETLQSVVQSLADSTGGDKVQIMVDGSVQVVASDHTDYGRPVSKEAHINPLRL